MEKQTVFRKVSVKDRLPLESGFYITNNCHVHFLSGWKRFIGCAEWWLEEIELPSENELNKLKPLGDDSEVNIYDTGFYNGVNYILNKLK